MSSTRGKCSICEKSLEKSVKSEVTTECGHTFHRACVDQRLRGSKNHDCPVCREGSALANASRLKSRQDDESMTHSAVSSRVTSGHSTMSKDEQEWTCPHCSMTNSETSTRCQSCAEPIRFPSTDETIHDPISPLGEPQWECDRCGYMNESSASNCIMCRKGQKFGGSSEAPPPAASVPASSSPFLYVCDLPFDTGEHYQLETVIRHRIEKNLKIPLTGIRCYSKLGVGIIHVADEETKNELINDIGRLYLNPKESNSVITFSDRLQLTSYVVIDVSSDRDDHSLPTADEVARRWEELFQEERSIDCLQLNDQYPNIFRVISISLDALVSHFQHQDFSIRDRRAHVYFCADCCFLEDLPPKTDPDQLRNSISDDLHLPVISLSSLYIQVNRQTATACLVATDEARKWSTAVPSFFVGEKSVSKKDHLSHRLLIRSVPAKISLQNIARHPQLAGKVDICRRNGPDVIVELSDRKTFDDLLRHGALRVDPDHRCSVEAYLPSNHPEASEIDATTWYESEMLQYKPDIMQFLAQPQHAIFRYRWNAQVWLEQYSQAGSEKADDSLMIMRRDRGGDGANETRHRLLVTVMLNTFGALLKGNYLIDDRPVTLNLTNQLQTIVYTHRSKLQAGGKMPLTATPYPKTRVYVIQDDCMDAYERLLRKGKRPLLLNMASATSPGGGYRKGDGAQEENIFRRSDYCRSLDTGIDEFLPLKSKRFHCSPTGQLEPLSDPTKMYPMDEFGAIYTSGLTFFRHPQESGYSYMKRPLENVCSLAMAAYRNPKLDGNDLTAEYAIGTRKKIENIFAIAHHHQHDCLVLSALGCGAFRNPPRHVAELFASVIEQYAGFFETIVFAVIDDHNTGSRINPHGNFKPFAEVLDGQIAVPVTLTTKPNLIFGPYRVQSDGSTVGDVRIFDLTPCKYGAKCRDVHNSSHTRQFSHPPSCAQAMIEGKCDLANDYVHMLSFLHRNQCKYGGQCRSMDDEKHSRDFEHPLYCSTGGYCQELNEEHLKQYRHVPMCDDALKCVRLHQKDKAHCASFRHCKPHCSYRHFCANFHDRKHISEFQHPFPKPCPFTPFNCLMYELLCSTTDPTKLSFDVEDHCLEYAHVCRFGRLCNNLSPLHWAKTIHIVRHLCPYGDKCKKLNQEDHLNSFSHLNVADIRSCCRYDDQCHDRHQLNHVLQYRHRLTREYCGIVRYYGLNKEITFLKNQCEGLMCLYKYTKREKWTSPSLGNIPQEILHWIRTVQPVHRCNPLIFESILLHGHVMSRDYMESLRNPKFVAFSILQHGRIRNISNLSISDVERYAKEYIIAYVTVAYERAKIISSSSVTSVQLLRSSEHTIRNLLDQKDFEVLKLKTEQITQASIKLHAHPGGIGFGADKDLGTDKHVFSILGPHFGHYYGDVILVFKREILHHPDADFYPQAATTFHSGNAFTLRPWLGDDPQEIPKRVAFYHHSKLHASIPGYERVIGMELMALTSMHKKMKTMDISLTEILDRSEKVDSHLCIEAHLPQLIPLSYVERIFIPKNLYDSLSSETRRTIDTIFKNRIDITPHQGDAEQDMSHGGPQPKSKSRAEYQSYVVSKLREQYERDAKDPFSRPLRGAFITIPATAFLDTCLLPVTISQVRMQYQIEHQKAPAEDTAYIYWQVTKGDMILALSVKPLDTNPGNSRCLICYIAPQCDARDRDYHEQATYLNCGSPMRHVVFENNHQYLAKSNTFHMGCTTTDFLTYCLEIHRSTGQVTLRHAGANAICNHQEITYQFKKEEFDVSKLDYLQVTANNQTVTVKDLIVCFGKQPDLHPTIDTHFKMDPGSDDAPGSHDRKPTKPKEPSASAKPEEHRAKDSHPRKH